MKFIAVGRDQQRVARMSIQGGEGQAHRRSIVAQCYDLAYSDEAFDVAV